MGSWSRSLEHDDRASAEQIVSLLRMAMVTSMVVLVGTGAGTATKAYAGWRPAILGGAGVYMVVALWKTSRDVRRGHTPTTGAAWALSVASAAFVVALVAVTGAGRSPLVPVGITVVIATAIRFDLVRSLAVALAMGVALGVIILAVPQPAVDRTDRVGLALWYLWLHVATAGFVGVLARVADSARRARARAEADAENEHRRLDQAQRTRRQLEAADAARRDFLLTLAHNFRMPIGSLETLSAALWRERSGLGPDQLKIVEMIEWHARSLAAMLQEVREVAVTESLEAARRVDVADVFVPDLIESATSAAGLAPGRLVAHVDDGLSILRTDPEKLLRIVATLLEEAGRRAVAGSPVEIRVARDGDGFQLVVTCRRRNGARVFPAEPYSGLGMWITAQLVEILGGVLEPEPFSSTGASVARVRFPAGSGVCLPPVGARTPR